jgi:DNA (cytosine-5)-methyltransferase 1
LIPQVARALTTSNQRIDAETETLLVARAFAENSRAELRFEGGDGQRVGAISTGGGKPGQGVPTIATALNWQAGGKQTTLGGGPVSSALVKEQIPGVQIGAAVRRLTPRECERLQGFPDGYTLVNVRGKPAADGPRYKALGNSMAVPVMRWIGERIQLVESTLSQQKAA